MEDIEKGLTSSDRFRAFFITDDDVRWKTIAFIIISGTAISAIDVLFLNPSLDELATFLTMWVLICYVVAVAWYCWFRNRPKVESTVPARRLFLQSAVAAIIYFFTWKIPRAEAHSVERRLQAASGKPIDVESIKETESVLSEAQAAGIVAAPTILEKLGKKYIHAGIHDPEAWDAALAFVNYKSFVNGSLTIPVLTLAGPALHTDYHFKYVEPFGRATQRAFGRVPKAQAAQLRMMDEPDLNASNEFGNDLIDLEGGGISLDNTQAKRVVFRKVHIVYAGGPIELQEVYFVNCIFHVEQKRNSPDLLGAALLPSPATSFRAS